MTTKSLRDILRKAAERDLGFRVRVAADIPGPGGGVFIAAQTELNERHLTWLEQRNPAPGASTFVEVVFTQDRAAPREALPHVEAPEAPDTAADRRRSAETHAREVGERAEAVNRQALEVYRIVGTEAFGEGALRNPKVRDNLRALDERLQGFHAAVHNALEEYLAGNSLIMGLISQFDPGARAVTHGLNVAVLATELASQILLKGSGDRPDDDILKRELAEIFVGGFLHDCGLWGETNAEGHEAAGARLIWHLPELRELAPALVNIALFHSDALRMATRPGLVRFTHHPDEPEQLQFRCEFYASEREAARAAKNHPAATHLDEAARRRVLAVALAEYCITQTEGFHARSLTEAVARLAHEAGEGLFAGYIVALCNIQVETIAPRRAYVALSGSMPTRDGQLLDLAGFSGGSLLHGNDASSPHLIVLSRQGPDGKPAKLTYVDPQDHRLWSRQTGPQNRFYLPTGRYDLALTVTGFMSEATYANILGEYEHALKGQMQV